MEIHKHKKKKKKISISRRKRRQHWISLRDGRKRTDMGENITLMQIKNQIKKLKKNKAAEKDKIKKGMWFYSTNKAKLRLLKIIQFEKKKKIV